MKKILKFFGYIHYTEIVQIQLEYRKEQKEKMDATTTETRMYCNSNINAADEVCQNIVSKIIN